MRGKQGVSYAMVDNYLLKRSPGRPQAFRPEEALDRAVELFWEHGYDGVDVDRIARAVHVTKPALYREFGDKPTLLLKAVQRYVESYGAPMMQAFLGEPDIRKAVTAFCKATVDNATGDRRTGCMMASAVLGQSERVAEIRAYVAQGLSASADVLVRRFEKEIQAKRLSAKIPAKVRGRAMIDLMQGLLLRAKAGTSRKELLKDALSYVPVILG
jgi:AcrR family transcriptional regulator